jgi:hypothetical protein
MDKRAEEGRKKEKENENEIESTVDERRDE